eukprot:CAMPEP_0178950368 /NCGR_PEP_ID=MMETSP0789-20121207/6612_1 /TAXON_ID=3005 /ORGANISM="Rhizosolenia setigera, Strain CCMP 1694" /LENGTH=985 /DNA_ID=CAMNT_0020631083 /DNA_START=193 /DNA_END=3150 /DNA_ORIENTATION=+
MQNRWDSQQPSARGHLSGLDESLSTSEWEDGQIFSQRTGRPISAPPSDDSVGEGTTSNNLADTILGSNRSSLFGIDESQIGMSGTSLYNRSTGVSRTSKMSQSMHGRYRTRDSFFSSYEGNDNNGLSSSMHTSRRSSVKDDMLLGGNGFSSNSFLSSPDHYVRFNLDLDTDKKTEDNNDTLSSLGLGPRQRPRSAAPPQINPPPGMEKTQTPPSTSSLLYGTPSSNGSQNGALLNSSVAIKRPASTGVIGGSQNEGTGDSDILQLLNSGLSSLRMGERSSVSEENAQGVESVKTQNEINRGLTPSNNTSSAVRPSPKTLMELIQEDFPNTSSPTASVEPDLQGPNSNTTPTQNKVNTQSALSRSLHGTRSVNFSPGSLNDQPRRHSNEDVHDTNTKQQTTNYPPAPQYVSVPVNQLHHPTYATHHIQQAPAVVHHAPVAYEMPRVYYSNPHQDHTQQGNSGGGHREQVLHHAPPAVYVIQPPYEHIQYAHHPMQTQPTIHHYHSHVPPSHAGQDPNVQQDFISIVPVQHPLPTMSADGSYTYWHVSGNTPQSQSDHMGANIHVLKSTRPGMGSPLSNSSLAKSQQRVKVPKDKIKGKRGGKKVMGNGFVSGVDLPRAKSPHGSIGSSVLEDFRKSKNRTWSVLDIRGHVVEFCQDQNGSRLIQQRLEISTDPIEKEIVMEEVLPSVALLRNDVFGNYVVQKLVEHGTPEMKAKLRDTLIGGMVPLSLQMYGCRVIQKALEAIPDEDIILLLSEFHNNVITCIHDQNGNHVIQKCIEVMSMKAKKDTSGAETYSEKIQFIIDDVLSNVTGLSCHPYGCRVMQRILEHCVDYQRLRALDEIALCHKTLLDDQYGNYVIQHVLQFGRESDRDSILAIVVRCGLLVLSRQKFASNVVEKLLKYGSNNQRNTLVREMLKPAHESETDSGMNYSVVLLMVRDAYANYVVQTTLDVVPEGPERQALLDELNKNSEQLRNYTFAKHIVAKLSS